MRKVALVALALLLLTACGVPIDDGPELIEVDSVEQPGLVPAVADDLASVSLFLIREGQLVPITRDLAAPVSVEAVVSSLLSDLTDPELRSGLRSSIPPGTTLIGVEVVGGIAELDLGRQFASVGGEEEVLAVAQIVLTLTSLVEVEAVTFLLDGVLTGVPTSSGAISDDPVTAGEYLDLVAG